MLGRVRTFGLVLLHAVCTGYPLPAGAQAAEPITITVGFAPGGGDGQGASSRSRSDGALRVRQNLQRMEDPS